MNYIEYDLLFESRKQLIEEITELDEKRSTISLCLKYGTSPKFAIIYILRNRFLQKL
ncbi:hypothetical protein KEH51_03430 [[Brevibacterium] frigoritolerans]|uniref:Uncharacterized protein n=1 Tax=Peribacillus frigoritolerans TaxID=450367 RepID=A0A941FQ19_9BACI|nr:hypothetical protein [Peribacillus frigoritolerans]